MRVKSLKIVYGNKPLTRKIEMNKKKVALLFAAATMFSPMIASAQSIAVALSATFTNNDGQLAFNYSDADTFIVDVPTTIAVAAALGTNAAANSASGDLDAGQASLSNAGGGDVSTSQQDLTGDANGYTSDILFFVDG